MGMFQRSGKKAFECTIGLVTSFVCFAPNLRAQISSFLEFATPTPMSSPSGITVGPDGALWFTELSGNKIGRITTAGSLTEFPVPTLDSQPSSITAGPDGALWFTETRGNNIGRITTSGTITEYAIKGNTSPQGITVGADSALWFTQNYSDGIGRVSVNGMITEDEVFSGSFLKDPNGITVGPDGALWFTEEGSNETAGNYIGRITTSGTLTEILIPTFDSNPSSITSGPDGALWFTESNAPKIGRITTGGAITEFPASAANFISVGPDGALWFTETSNNKIGRITTANLITEYIVPTPSSQPFGITAGPDGALWFTEMGAGKIGRLQVAADGNNPLISSLISASGFGAFPAIAPGSWIEIYGANLATTSARGWTGSDFKGNQAPTSLDSVSVTIGGQPAFVAYISSQQVNALAPINIAAGQQQVVVKTAVSQSAPFMVQVNNVEPGLYAPGVGAFNEKQFAIGTFADGSLVLPEGAIPCAMSRRAQPGDSITLYGIGFGPVSPPVPAGEITPSKGDALDSAFDLSFGNTPAAVSYDGMAPSTVGLYQFNTLVPNISSGNEIPLKFSTGGVVGTQDLYVAIQLQGPVLSSVSLGSPGTVYLSGPAPPEGAIIALFSDLPSNVMVPCTVTVMPNAISQTFPMTFVTYNTNGQSGPNVTIAAMYNGSQVQSSVSLPCTPGSSGAVCPDIKQK